MKKLVFGLIVILLFGCGDAKKKSDPSATGTSLEKRLSEYIQLTEDMDLEKLMDYIYPRLFTIAPKEEMLKAMKEGFDNDEVKVSLDSLKIEKIYPVFEVGKGSYAKVTYSMVMVMELMDKEKLAEQMELIRAGIAAKYGNENLNIDGQSGAFRIRQTNNLVAIKDNYAKEWSFISLKEDDPTMNQLLNKDVMGKLNEYN